MNLRQNVPAALLAAVLAMVAGYAVSSMAAQRKDAPTHTVTEVAHIAKQVKAKVRSPNPGLASEPNPCQLVPEAAVKTILHAPNLTETEAPLGPTCVISLPKHRTVTITVAPANVASESREMKNRTARLRIAGHSTYCGKLGASVLLAKLAHGDALQINAPCSEAAALAQMALPNVKA